MAEGKQGVKRSRSGSSTNASGEDEAPVVKKDRSISTDMCEDDRNKVAILDAGAQYGKIIDRRVRELFVKADMLPLDTLANEIVKAGYRAVIISGSPGSVVTDMSLSCDRQLMELGLPVLGICFGMQLLNKLHGGQVGRTESRSDGQFEVDIDTTCPLFE